MDKPLTHFIISRGRTLFKLSLESLLSPVAPETFFSDIREKRELLIQRNDPEFYSNLGILENIEFLLSSVISQNNGSLELIKAVGVSQAAQRSVPVDMASVYKGYRSGESIRCSSLQRHVPAVWTLSRELEEAFKTEVSVNMYISCKDSQALPIHFDRHDAFILQIFGEKDWQLYSTPIELPLESLPRIEFEPVSAGRRRLDRDYSPVGHPHDEPTLSTTLTAGDLLYLPRGLVHQVRTSTKPSIHLTIGIQTLTNYDLTLLALTRLARKDSTLRRSLPAGNTSASEEQANLEALAAALNGLRDVTSLQRSLVEVKENFWKSRDSFGEGVLLQEEGSEQAINHETVLERRPGIITYLKPTLSTTTLFFADKSIKLASEDFPTLNAILQAKTFRVTDLPDSLSISARLQLVKQLMKTGLLRIRS